MVFVPGQHSWVGIMCGPDGDDPCLSVPDIDWSITPPTAGYVNPSLSDNHGVTFTVTGYPGQTGEITAIIDADHGCSKPFTISSPDCWEYS
jgi:hypothetical protein